ncbi:MAG: hypothetical protein H6505_03055 [Calditrichaeota bacterium]|nr:hypothetical protein [Calditrichota bacterium]
MKTIALFVIAASVFTKACQGPESSGPKNAPEGFGTAQKSDLVIEAQQSSVQVEWGTTAEVKLNVSWKAGQKYAVQVAPAAGTPEWLNVSVKPVILDPPGVVTVMVSPELGWAKRGTHKIKLQASAYALKDPVETEVEIEVVRQSGSFEALQTLGSSIECRNICGKVSNGRIAFYDLLKEKGQECDDKKALPDNQRIGLKQYSVSSKGYGFGRTCAIAGVWENTGSLTLVNVGFFERSIPRGDAFMTIRSAERVWLSPDNTIAIAQSGSAFTPYDVMTGNQIGEQCRSTGDVTGIRVDGERLVVFSSKDCEWQVK